METFWNTIASYNAATWPAQLALTLAAVVLTLLLYFRPSPAVRIAMKVFMALLNFWIAGVYYLVCCEPREHHDLLALFWAIMGCIWVYDLAVGHASATHGQPQGVRRAAVRHAARLPAVLAPAGPHLPDDHLAGDALLGGGLHHRADAGLSERVNIVLAMFLCHWALIGLSEGLLLRHSRITCWHAASSRRCTSSSANTSATTPGGPRNPRRGCSPTRCSR